MNFLNNKIKTMAKFYPTFQKLFSNKLVEKLIKKQIDIFRPVIEL